MRSSCAGQSPPRHSSTSATVASVAAVATGTRSTGRGRTSEGMPPIVDRRAGCVDRAGQPIGAGKPPARVAGERPLFQPSGVAERYTIVVVTVTCCIEPGST